MLSKLEELQNIFDPMFDSSIGIHDVFDNLCILQNVSFLVHHSDWATLTPAFSFFITDFDIIGIAKLVMFKVCNEDMRNNQL